MLHMVEEISKLRYDEEEDKKNNFHQYVELQAYPKTTRGQVIYLRYYRLRELLSSWMDDQLSHNINLTEMTKGQSRVRCQPRMSHLKLSLNL